MPLFFAKGKFPPPRETKNKKTNKRKIKQGTSTTASKQAVHTPPSPCALTETCILPNMRTPWEGIGVPAATKMDQPT